MAVSRQDGGYQTKWRLPDKKAPPRQQVEMSTILNAADTQKLQTNTTTVDHCHQQEYFRIQWLARTVLIITGKTQHGEIGIDTLAAQRAIQRKILKTIPNSDELSSVKRWNLNGDKYFKWTSEVNSSVELKIPTSEGSFHSVLIPVEGKSEHANPSYEQNPPSHLQNRDYWLVFRADTQPIITPFFFSFFFPLIFSFNFFFSFFSSFLLGTRSWLGADVGEADADWLVSAMAAVWKLAANVSVMARSSSSYLNNSNI